MSDGNISQGTLALFRDASSTYLVIRDIRNAFEGAGFAQVAEFDPNSRKSVFDSYTASRDLSDQAMQRKLRHALAQLVDVIGVKNEEATKPLINALSRNGLKWDGVKLLSEQGDTPAAGDRAATVQRVLPPSVVADEIEELLRAIPRALRELEQENRYEKRLTLPMNDEFDLQDLLRSYLVMRYPLITPEDWVPKVAGKAGRVDFALRGEKVFLELKFVRSVDQWKSKVRPSIFEKLETYSRDPDCDVLIVFIFDPTRCLRDAAKIEYDFSGERGDVNKRWTLRTVVEPQL